MTCANHPDRQSTAFCQHCGKPICADCTRTAGAAVFCEPCLAARLGSNPPPVAPVYASVPTVPGEPSPTLAAILGVIPGVGAMYNGQYAKGVIHMVIFMILASLGQNLPAFIFFTIGWEFYQVMEAYHTARARRDGLPLPNPFGLNDLGERLGFGKGWSSAEAVPPPASSPNPPPAAGSAPDATAPPYSYSYGYQYQYPPTPYPPASYPPPTVPPIAAPTDEELAAWQRNRFPAAAIWLIALGLIFLLGNLHLFPRHSAVRLIPLLLIGAGVWAFVRSMSGPGLPGEETDPTLHRLRTLHALHRSFWLFLVGVLWMLDAWDILRWRYSWPFFFIAGGVMLLVRRAALFAVPMPYSPPPAAAPAASADPGTTLIHKPLQQDQEN